jgi:phenylacetic acid degradation operon negative regulatory protein
MVAAMAPQSSTNSLHVSSKRMTARSVLLSVLLGTDPPQLPVQVLVRTTELFGIAEGTTRTALSRMAAAGEVEAVDGSYAIAAGRLLARQARQTASRAGRTRPWRGGRWRQAVVVADGRRAASERAALRAALAQARLAELREGVWLRPDNLEVDVDGPALRWATVVPDGDPATLAAELWDLDAWSGRSNLLRRRMVPLVGPLTRGDHRVLAEGFLLSADILRHLQADPLLPEPLQPPGWPGADLRAEYDEYDRAYRAVLRAWFR